VIIGIGSESPTVSNGKIVDRKERWQRHLNVPVQRFGPRLRSCWSKRTFWMKDNHHSGSEKGMNDDIVAYYALYP
jgi:hypothetical protein